MRAFLLGTPQGYFTTTLTPEQLAQVARDQQARRAAPRSPLSFLRFANERTRDVQREQMQRVHTQLTSVEKRLDDMDVMGIEIQAISPAPVQIFYWTEPDLGIASARLVNDNIAEIVGRHPGRFVGLGTIPFQAPELAIQELERLVKSLGLRGIEISSNVAGEDFSSPRFRPIFA